LCTAVLADDAAMKRCREIADAQKRLACYDALPLGTTPPAAPAAAAPSAAPAPTIMQSLVQRFGFEQRRAREEPESITSTIPGLFEGWGPRSRIRLANGQVWQITDDSSRWARVENPKVTVRRGALGSFFLDIENINPAPRVRRVQ
jgi:hypothetical protein